MNIEEKLRAASPEQYGDNYGAHLMEQYRLYVEMADRISHRRQTANGFGLSINTGLLGVVGLVASRCTPSQMLPMIAAIAVAGIVMSYGWYRLICSYRDLNTTKFAVIHAIEARLPIAPYAAEWLAVGEGQNPKLYKPFSHIEVWIPRVFMMAYGAALLYSVIMLIVQMAAGGGAVSTG